MKDPIEVRLPSRNRILVVPRVKKSGDSMSPALCGDLLLYFHDGPVIENKIGGRSRNVYHWFNSHLQLLYRITRRLAEVVHLLSIHSPLEGSTDIGAE